MTSGQTIFRDSRRRRVLQDDGRRASNYAPTPVTEGARYTDAANVENHPQVTQFIPRRYRSYVLALTLAAAAIAAIELSHVLAGDLAGALASGPVVALDLAAGGGLAAWFSALVLAALSVVACIVYSLRKHRVDDYRARYRLWLWVAGAAMLASADSVARFHELWTRIWVSQTSWAALGGAVWWLAPAGLFGLWLAVRLVLETAECRGACGLVLASAAAYSLALGTAAGLLPSAWSSAELVVLSAAVLVGHVVALAAVTLYARYVVLDVQGLIPRKDAKDRVSKANAANVAAKSETAANGDASFPATIPINSPAAQDQRRAGRKAAQNGKKGSVWVDGSEPEGGDDEEDARSAGKLSKADRKRLRKQRRQAA